MNTTATGRGTVLLSSRARAAVLTGAVSVPGAASDPAAGNWSSPTLLLFPQSDVWHVHPTEYYPAFQGNGDGYVYAPATGIPASNRNYQVIWRAELARAHLPSAWEVLHDGSVFHWENRPGQPSIWGQTISAFVDGSRALLRVMYPTLDAKSVGSMNLASAPWVPEPGGGPGGSIGQRERGFWLSAPGMRSLALTTGALAPAAALDVTLVVAGEGFSLLWNSNSPYGANAYPFPSDIHALSLCNVTAFVLGGGAQGAWQLLSLPPARAGTACAPVVVASGRGCSWSSGAPVRLQVSQDGAGFVNVSCDGVEVLAGAPAAPAGGASALGGRAGLLAPTNTALNISAFVIAAGWRAAPPPLALLAVEGMLGAGVTGGFSEDATPGLWRFGSGLICSAGAECAHMAKFNFVGVSVALWAPRGLAGAGNVTVSVDGAPPAVIDLSSPSGVPIPSSTVWSSGALSAGRHAVVVRSAASATLPVDSVDVDPVPVVG